MIHLFTRHEETGIDSRTIFTSHSHLHFKAGTKRGLPAATIWLDLTCP